MISILGIIIADDEKKICRLLEYLIDWDKIGAKLLGVAYDGITALRLIQEKKPDVLLTDIRMPGMDGLQLIKEAKKQNAALKCIIISGYKDFQYAQQGIRYGVRDYLLKPIDQDDLTRTLKKLANETMEQKSSQEARMHLEKTVRNYSGEFKRVFLKIALDQKPAEKFETVLKEIRKINTSWAAEQDSRCLVVRPDIEYKDFTKDAYQLLIDKTIEILQVEFASEEGELTIETSDEGIFLLICRELDKEELINAVNHVRDRVMRLQDLFPKLYFSAVITEPVDTDEELVRQIQHSRIAMYNRLLTDNDTVSELKMYNTESENKHALTAQISRLLENQPESFEPEEIKKYINEAKWIMCAAKGISGLDVKMELFRLVCNYLNWFGQLDTALDKSRKTAYFSEMYEHCSSLDQAFELLEETLIKASLEVLNYLKSKEKKPIAYAKHYIEENKGLNIKLDELAKTAGFSYTYFSYLFKKETGKTLTEYIRMVRIETAKKLLVEKERSISEIAELVGYSDIKFFTKQFKKVMGVSPNEYRKMFLER